MVLSVLVFVFLVLPLTDQRDLARSTVLPEEGEISSTVMHNNEVQPNYSPNIAGNNNEATDFPQLPLETISVSGNDNASNTVLLPSDSPQMLPQDKSLENDSGIEAGTNDDAPISEASSLSPVSVPEEVIASSSLTSVIVAAVTESEGNETSAETLVTAEVEDIYSTAPAEGEDSYSTISETEIPVNETAIANLTAFTITSFVNIETTTHSVALDSTILSPPEPSEVAVGVNEVTIASLSSTESFPLETSVDYGIPDTTVVSHAPTEKFVFPAEKTEDEPQVEGRVSNPDKSTLSSNNGNIITQTVSPYSTSTTVFDAERPVEVCQFSSFWRLYVRYFPNGRICTLPPETLDWEVVQSNLD
ncbi:MAG: hypothetical protein GY696_25730 [Gammaproteobacteria bacterium]|nr:hypothetical protein [Gammaproteobacteria bacterium]